MICYCGLDECGTCAAEEEKERIMHNIAERAETEARNITLALGGLRKKVGLNQRDAAKAIGITQGYLSLLENGHRPNVSLEVLHRLYILYQSHEEEQ